MFFFPDVSSYMVLSYHFRIWVCLKTRYTVYPKKLPPDFAHFPTFPCKSSAGPCSIPAWFCLASCPAAAWAWSRLFHLDVSEKIWTRDILFDIPPTLFFPNDFNDKHDRPWNLDGPYFQSNPFCGVAIPWQVGRGLAHVSTMPTRKFIYVYIILYLYYIYIYKWEHMKCQISLELSKGTATELKSSSRNEDKLYEISWNCESESFACNHYSNCECCCTHVTCISFVSWSWLNTHTHCSTLLDIEEWPPDSFPNLHSILHDLLNRFKAKPFGTSGQKFKLVKFQ